MFDWLLRLGGILPSLLDSATITGNLSETLPAEGRVYAAAGYVPTSHISPYTYSGAHATHHHDYHPHIHNETHYHIITYLNGTVYPVNYTHSHPHYYGHHHSGYGGDGLGLTSALSSWYQLNMGLIGIGALAVVAIIGSRNFFGNYLTLKKYPSGGYEGYGYDMYGTGYGGGGGYNHRSWYDEWYDYWYGDKNKEVYDPYKNGGPGYDRNKDPYSRDHDLDARTDHDPRTRDWDDSNRYHSRYRRTADQSTSDNNTETDSTLDTSQENDSEYDSLNLPENFDEMNSTSFDAGDILFEYVPEGPEGPESPSEEELSLTHCGFRLICELSRQRKRQLTKDEWEILRLIKFSDLRMSAFPPGEGILPNHAAIAAFRVAGRLGASGYPCHSLRGKCPVQDDLIDGAAKQFFQIKQNKLKKKVSGLT